MEYILWQRSGCKSNVLQIIILGIDETVWTILINNLPQQAEGVAKVV